MSISRALLMNSPVVILMLLALISTGRTFILDESGCTIRFWKFQKKYTWDQLKTKRIEKFDSPPIITGAFSCYYLTEAVLCPHKIHKPKFVRPSTYGIIHPFSCVYINFNLCNDKWQRGRYYEAEEAVFREKMKQWGIELEEIQGTGTEGQGDGSLVPTPTTTSTQVATHTVASSGFNAAYSYTYDDNGNILSVSDGTYTTSYAYDSANQLIRENNQKANKTWTWDYDNAGNILGKKEYTYTTGTLGTPTDTIDYAYGNDNWGDLLTSYDGKAITYDGVGNMLTYGNNTYSWKHGRQLESMTKDGFVWDYTYNADGLRTSRSSDDYEASYQYYYSGDQLVRMELEEGYGGSSLLQGYMEFSYDANGTPLSVDCNLNFYEEDGYYDNDGNYIDLTVDEDFICTLYYITNLQGDVIALVDESGELVLEYGYDAWGRIIRYQCYADFRYICYYQPLRYRGYVYDYETGLYYLQSRYYDPELGRFINADGQISGVGGDLLGYNQFAYCFNNPVNMSDSSGNWPKLLSGVDDLIKNVVKTLVKVLAVQIVYACSKNLISSRKSADYEAVDKLLENRTVETGNVQLPADTTGLLYNRANRIYASQIIQEDLGGDTQRTISNISSEIFAHQFVADIAKPFSILSGRVPVELDIYGRLSKADIDEGEDRIELFDYIEGAFEWE